ncbi:MAG: PAS domain-containing protein, partial [Alphaproteobacteria bacterium]|nr:PAS domain-containing protein [Alphaproteobacteria bacterium]
MESACALTGADYGAITALDESGQPGDLVAFGLTEAERREMSEHPDGRLLLEYFRDLPRPLRVADGSVDLSSLGLSSVLLPSKTLLGTPLRHRGVYVGKFCLFEKEGGKAFSDEDEEVLVLFASQAAAAIANAGMHRAERQARADLEALIETSPVGVAVFDAATGSLLSLNREARRLVESLAMPGQSLEELLDSVTCRRADGREFVLRQFSLLGQLSDVRQVRAEEIVLSVPDGRSVPTLVNATPIRSEDGNMVSLVVTMQDLAPLEEVDRLRADFLGMVSHELRVPLTSIKGSTTTALGASPAPDPAEMREFLRIIDDQADRMRSLIRDLLDGGRLGSGPLSVCPEPRRIAGRVGA